MEHMIQHYAAISQNSDEIDAGVSPINKENNDKKAVEKCVSILLGRHIEVHMASMFITTNTTKMSAYKHILCILSRTSSFYVVCFLLGNSPASEFCMPTFRNTLVCSIFIGR
jgi:predicted ABC-type ATPase